MANLLLAAGLVVIGLIVFCGLYVLLKGVRNVQMAMASAKWPKTAGVVVYSKTTRDASPQKRRTKYTVIFSTKTIIRYKVNGQEYTTDVLHFGQTLGSGDKSEATLLHMRYPEGQEVMVSYNPGNPAIAVMKPGLQ